MPDHLAPLRRHVVLLLVALVLATTAACAPIPAGRPGATAASIQDQLAQLAASAQPASTATQAISQASATRAVSVTTAAVQPSPTRTKRPAAAATATSRPTRRPTATAMPRTSSIRATRTPSDGLQTIRESQLPPEAQRTLALIRQGGPFPYDKDGATFGNREGLLPKHPLGYYKEYTVITPGSRDRGARRIVAGKGGELYYTSDHYDSFKRVIP